MKPQQSGPVRLCQLRQPGYPNIWDPWLSVPRLLVVWLYRCLFSMVIDEANTVPNRFSKPKLIVFLYDFNEFDTGWVLNSEPW